MSYAEQHIFLANRPLTLKQREHAESLSSHATVGANYAIYTYVYGGSFKGSEDELLTKGGFDAMLWQDSSGRMHLRFRLPEYVIPANDFRPYAYREGHPAIETKAMAIGQNILFSIRCDNEDGEDQWLENHAEPLQRLLPLRDDLIAGDYRLLYLIWWHNHLQIKNIEDDTQTRHPPVPAALIDLPEHLTHFCDRCGIDHKIIIAAGPQSELDELPDYDENLFHMERSQMREYLLGILNDEPDLSAKLRRELAQMDG